MGGRCFLVLLLLSFNTLASGDDTDPRIVEWRGRDSAWVEWTRLSGNWNDWRSQLEDIGITTDITWTIDTSKVESGGVRRRTGTRSLFQIQSRMDLETLLDLPGTALGATYYTQVGSDGSRHVGDIQAYDNLDAPNRNQLAELWVEHVSADERWTTKLGRMDANGDFAAVESATEFIHSSMGFTPTIHVFPSYPDPALGVSVRRDFDDLAITVGAFDGALHEGVSTGKTSGDTFLGDPSDLFLVSELALGWSVDPEDSRPGRFAVGAWHHTGHFDRFSGSRDSGTEGQYAILEQTLWTSEQGRTLTLFGQYGRADESVNSVAEHFGYGLVLRGPCQLRPDDVIGFGVTQVNLSDEAGAGFTEHREVNYEFFYRAPVTPWLVIQPDVQWISDPGGDVTIDDAVVWSLRVEIAI